MKALKVLNEENKISSDCIMIINEMYLQKGTQTLGGKHVGADEEGQLYKGITTFIIVNLNFYTPYVILALPEVLINGH